VKSKAEETALVCRRVADLGEPAVQSTVDTCEYCGKPVWRANSSPPADHVICVQCVKREDPDYLKRAEIPTYRQLLDIKKNFLLI